MPPPARRNQAVREEAFSEAQPDESFWDVIRMNQKSFDALVKRGYDCNQ